MVSRQNIDGRPRPSGVLPTVQAGPTVGISDPNPTTVGPISQGPRSGGRTGRRGRRGGRAGRDGVIPDLNGEEEHFPPPPSTPPPPPTGGPDDPYPPGKGPQPQVPPTQPTRIPGGSRSGGGAGYRARTGKVARETTEGQERAGRRGRFGQQHVDRYGRTIPPGGGAAQGEYGRRYGRGGLGPRWSTSEGGGGYGTIPPPLPPPPPPPEPEPPPEEREPRDRDGRRGRGGRRRTGRGRLR